MKRIFLIALAAVATLAGCGIPAGTGMPTPDPSSPVDGVVIAVDSAGLNEVRGFTMRTDEGWSFDFALGSLENPLEFPPGHLAEHMATSSPVRAWFRLEEGRRVVYRLEDAPEG